MNLNEVFESLDLMDADWKVTVNTALTDGACLFVAKIDLINEGTSFGGVDRDPVGALEKAVALAERTDNNDYNEDNLDEAKDILKSALEEIGFDRLVALLERLHEENERY